MPLRWKIFRVLCIVQLLAASFFAMELLIGFIYSISLGRIAILLLYSAIFFLCVLGINLVNNNFPDDPVDGVQKKSYNRIFLLNFLFLSVLFALVFREFRVIKTLVPPGWSFFSLPINTYPWFFGYLLMLLLQLSILYGLYKLRVELQSNFLKRKFEFEKP